MKSIYSYIANNYYRMRKEELKTILLEALVLLDNEEPLIEVLLDGELYDFEYLEDKEEA